MKEDDQEMKVLLTPEPGVATRKDDLPASAAGLLLTLYGEPCHEGSEEIYLHGCGRSFLVVETGELCSVGVLAELPEREVRARLNKASFMREGALQESSEVTPEMEGSLAMVSLLAGVVWSDLLIAAKKLRSQEVGSIFGVRNSGSGSRLVRRDWAKRSHALIPI